MPSPAAYPDSPMLIVCPSCASEYDIDAAKLGPGGRTVRCAACRTKFHVAPPPAAEEEAREREEQPDAWGLAPEEQDEPPPQQPMVPATIDPDAPALSIEAGADPGQPPPRPRRRGPAARKPRKAGAASPLLIRAGTIAACLGILAGLLLFREQVVRVLPDTARLFATIGLPVNLRGLDFAQVRTTVTGEGREAILVVEGEIANPTGKTVDIPPLAFAVSGPDGIPLYTWGTQPPRQSLGPGETTRFRTRLAAPPPDSRQVLVQFAPAPGGTPVARGP